MVVLHHLITKLEEAAAEGRLRGEVIIIPVVNPIGISQFLNNELVGRFDFFGQGNFNRKFPDITDAVADRIAETLESDPQRNLEVIRHAIRAELEAREASTESSALKLMIARLAADADIALDLHCDGESLLHMYTCNENWPLASELAAQMNIPVVLLGVDRVAYSFDDALNLLWSELVGRFKAYPIPHGCLAASIELRGRANVDDIVADSDADNIYKFLMRRGVLEGDPGTLPEPVCQGGTPLSGVDQGMAPVAGVALFRKNLGDAVGADEVVAEVVDVGSADPNTSRYPVKSRTTGILFSIDLVKMVRPGSPFFKVAGEKPLEKIRESFLED
jgi:predicted deacylase